jgi:hypothetical protein
MSVQKRVGGNMGFGGFANPDGVHGTSNLDKSAAMW